MDVLTVTKVAETDQSDSLDSRFLKLRQICATRLFPVMVPEKSYPLWSHADVAVSVAISLATGARNPARSVEENVSAMDKAAIEAVLAVV